MGNRSIEAFDAELRTAARLLPRRFVGPATLGLGRALLDLRRPMDGVESHDLGNASVRVHRPSPRDEPSAALLWIHGGGMISGTAGAEDLLCRSFADEHGIVVAAVEYRLAPEAPFPAAIEDCHDALEWLAARSEVRADRIVIGGASAGGGLAAGLALLARDRGVVSPSFQLLQYPMLDDRTAADFANDDRPVRVWDNIANRFGWECYLGMPPGAADVSPYAAPARAEDLSGLPPAWIGVGTCDLFLAEDVDYAARLEAAGVPCELHLSEGAFHGSEMVVAKAAVSEAFVASRRDALAGAVGD